MNSLKHFVVLLTVFFAVKTCLAADGSLLKPPAGAKVAIVVFEDLECPSCAKAYPQIWQAANASHVPVVLHDFPLSKHPWSFQAAVDARFLDTKSEKLGIDFRGFIYQNQPQITRENLSQYFQKFADDNKVPVPFAVDPQSKLEDKIRADYNLGLKCELTGTPTIFVVGRGADPSFIEVKSPDDLAATIAEMQKKTGASSQRGRSAGRKKSL
jgi:protein-disulfide isomerase